jgi:hypothetical protein
MKKPVRMASILLVAAPLLLSGCAGIGPGTVTRDRFDYTTAISESWKSQMLINMVKLRYGDAPIFLDVASVINSYEVSGSGSLGASWFHPSSYALTSSQNLGASGTYANRPTITYSPLTGEKFAKSLMAPIPPSSILTLIQSGYPVDLVFRGLVHSINGVKNRFGGSASARSADPEFYSLIEKMRRIQASGVIGLRIQKLNEAETTVMVFSSKTDKEIEADVAEIKKILGLDPGAREFKVVFGLVQANDKEIAILSRSMLQVLSDLASYIEVPEIDVTEKRVNSGLKDEPVGGVPVTTLVRIHSSSHRPDDAFVTVPYHNHWFWIDDKDLPSKQMFSFLMFIFTLVETGGKEGAPVVTIPAR